MRNENIFWKLLSFAALSNLDVYRMIQLRLEVFSLEQKCFYQDLDNIDFESYHLLGFDEDVLVAYTRLVPPKLKYDEMSIGRVITKKTHRKYGLGKDLMELSIQHIIDIYGKQPIKIGAQLYLLKFYQSFGFEQVSEVYLEDDIPHILMLKKWNNVEL